MRIVDAFLAIPLVILATVALVSLGPSKGTLIVVIGIVFAPIIARTVRAAVLSERELEYVEAARLRNERAPYIMFAEILPNVTAPIVVEFTVRLGYAIFAIATLTFLGFGVQPPSPDWGLQIKENYVILNGGYWWPTLFPALAIALLVVSINLIADGLTRGWSKRDRTNGAPALELDDLRVAYTVRGIPRPVLRGVTLEIGPGRVLWTGGRVRLRQIDGCLRDHALPGPKREGDRRLDPARRPRARRHERRRGAPLCAPTSVDGLPEPRRGPEPVHPDRDPGRGGVPPARFAGRRSAGAKRGDAAEGADRGPGAGPATLPAPAFGRNAAAGRHRDGARLRPNPPHPRRADDGPRRNRGGGGARASSRGSEATWGRASSSSATTSPSSRECASASASSTQAASSRKGGPEHSSEDPRHPYTVGLLRCIPRGGLRKGAQRLDTIPGFLPSSGPSCRAASLPTGAASPGRSAASRSPRSTPSEAAMQAAATSTTRRSRSPREAPTKAAMRGPNGARC